MFNQNIPSIHNQVLQLIDDVNKTKPIRISDLVSFGASNLSEADKGILANGIISFSPEENEDGKISGSFSGVLPQSVMLTSGALTLAIPVRIGGTYTSTATNCSFAFEANEEIRGNAKKKIVFFNVEEPVDISAVAFNQEKIIVTDNFGTTTITHKS